MNINNRKPSNNKNGVPIKKTSVRPSTPNIKPAVKPSNKQGGIPINKTGARPINKPTGKSKYDAPKRPKIPTPVIITNLLMVCVILSLVGIIFAIALNNAKYDKDDALKNNKNQSSVSSTASVSSTPADTNSGAANSNTSAVTSNTGADNSTTSVDFTPADGNFDKEFFKDDLFIGDSIFTGLYLYSHLERKNVAAAIGYTAYGAQVSVFDETFFSGSAVDYAKSIKPKRIFIMLGSNSLSPKTNFDDFENGYRGLINALKSGCPDSTICVISVPPITADSSMASYSGVTNTIINTANTRIKALAETLGVMYYDFNAIIKDSDGNFKEEYAEADGMHFLNATYPVLLSGLQKAVGQ